MVFKKGQSGNPNGRPKQLEAAPTPRMDGWKSTITGIGHALFDKRLSAIPTLDDVSDEEAQLIYRGDDMGGRAVDIWPTTMLREAFDLNITEMEKGSDELEEDITDISPEDGAVTDEKGEPDEKREDSRSRRLDSWRKRRTMRRDAAAKKLKKLGEDALKKWKDLKGKERFKEALCYAIAYGGGAILLGAKDGSTDWSKPLEADKVTGGAARGFDWMTSLEPRELTPISWYDNPLEAKFGEPKIYQINTTPPGVDRETPTERKLVNVHETRLIIFQGVRVSRNQISQRVGFGDSIFVRVKSVLRDFNMGWSGAAIIMQEFCLATMQIEDLQSMVNAGPEGQKKILARMAAVQLGRSVAKLTLIGKGETYTREFANVSGLAELLEKFMTRLAAAFEVPVTLLMGMAPAGLNATGDSDIRSFYDKVKARQIDQLEPELMRVFELILRCVNNGKVPEKWCIEFKSLWQESPKEKADTRLVDATSDEKNILNGIYTAEEARASRFGGEKYASDITIKQEEESDELNQADVDAYKASQDAPPELGPDGQPLEVAPQEGVAQDGQPAAPGNTTKLGPDGKPLPGQEPTAAPAMNTAQEAKPVDKMKALEIIQSVTGKDISYLSGIAMFKFVFGITDEQAKALLGPEAFAAPAPVPPGLGGPPIPPGGKAPVLGEAPAEGDKPETKANEQPKGDVPAEAPAEEDKTK